MKNGLDYSLRVSPCGSKWNVDYKAGRFPVSMGKNAAIDIAAHMGKFLHILEIAVCDKDGGLVETLDVIQ
jgi:hypothetical protein